MKPVWLRVAHHTQARIFTEKLNAWLPAAMLLKRLLNRNCQSGQFCPLFGPTVGAWI